MNKNYVGQFIVKSGRTDVMGRIIRIDTMEDEYVIEFVKGADLWVAHWSYYLMDYNLRDDEWKILSPSPVIAAMFGFDVI